MKKIISVFIFTSIILFTNSAMANMLPFLESQMNSSGGVFSEATSKANEVFQGLRTLAYILAGFGLAAFATAAIFGKISFKWLALICVGLFILSVAEPLATYITDGSGGGSSQTPGSVTGNDDGEGSGGLNDSGDIGGEGSSNVGYDGDHNSYPEGGEGSGSAGSDGDYGFTPDSDTSTPSDDSPLGTDFPLTDPTTGELTPTPSPDTGSDSPLGTDFPLTDPTTGELTPTPSPDTGSDSPLGTDFPLTDPTTGELTPTSSSTPSLDTSSTISPEDQTMLNQLSDAERNYYEKQYNADMEKALQTQENFGGENSSSDAKVATDLDEWFTGDWETAKPMTEMSLDEYIIYKKQQAPAGT